MKAYIYRCSRKPDMYLYLAEKDRFEDVPAEIFRTLGQVEFALELALDAGTKLAREDARTVLANLKENGFHLQLPASEPVEAIMARIAEENMRRARKK